MAGADRYSTNPAEPHVQPDRVEARTALGSTGFVAPVGQRQLGGQLDGGRRVGRPQLLGSCHERQVCGGDPGRPPGRHLH